MELPKRNVSKMVKLVFATSNINKVREVTELLQPDYEIVPMSEIGCTVDIPETSDTFEGNALLKARYLKEHFGVDCFSEDTGLEIEALGGEPGVFTARYGGSPQDPIKNMNLVLEKLKNKTNRSAQFRTAIALILNKKEYIFEGIVKGTIAYNITGTGGFGYDPIFIPEGHDQTFGELAKSIKYAISHRSRAIQKLVSFLDSNKT